MRREGETRREGGSERRREGEAGRREGGGEGGRRGRRRRGGGGGRGTQLPSKTSRSTPNQRETTQLDGYITAKITHV